METLGIDGLVGIAVLFILLLFMFQHMMTEGRRGQRWSGRKK